ncbi:MAG TPA: DUF4430 domain-containing protein [Thermoplasmata archaeon]
MNERRQAILLVVLLIPAIAGLYAATQLIQPAPVQPSVVRAVRLEAVGVDWTIVYDAILTTNNTAFSLLMEASHALGFPVAYVPYGVPRGMFVTAINGSVNGEGNRYWQYWVGGAYGDVAADLKPLRDGDTVLWKFVLSVEGG